MPVLLFRNLSIILFIGAKYNTKVYNIHKIQDILFKGLRPVLEGFVVPMHEGGCETGSQIPRA